QVRIVAARECEREGEPSCGIIRVSHGDEDDVPVHKLVRETIVYVALQRASRKGRARSIGSNASDDVRSPQQVGGLGDSCGLCRTQELSRRQPSYDLREFD